jgi:hypothetical protein
MSAYDPEDWGPDPPTPGELFLTVLLFTTLFLTVWLLRR